VSVEDLFFKCFTFSLDWREMMIELYLLVNTNIGVINISACMKPNAREWTFPFFDDVFLQFQSSNEKVTR
jgi:hypothetical protein